MRSVAPSLSEEAVSEALHKVTMEYEKQQVSMNKKKKPTVMMKRKRRNKGSRRSSVSDVEKLDIRVVDEEPMDPRHDLKRSKNFLEIAADDEASASVELEARNRLLAEQNIALRDQNEEQAARIAELERNLSALKEERSSKAQSPRMISHEIGEQQLAAFTEVAQLALRLDLTRVDDDGETVVPNPESMADPKERLEYLLEHWHAISMHYANENFLPEIQEQVNASMAEMQDYSHGLQKEVNKLREKLGEEEAAYERQTELLEMTEKSRLKLLNMQKEGKYTEKAFVALMEENQGALVAHKTALEELQKKCDVNKRKVESLEEKNRQLKSDLKVARDDIKRLRSENFSLIERRSAPSSDPKVMSNPSGEGEVSTSDALWFKHQAAAFRRQADENELEILKLKKSVETFTQERQGYIDREMRAKSDLKKAEAKMKRVEEAAKAQLESTKTQLERWQERYDRAKASHQETIEKMKDDQEKSLADKMIEGMDAIQRLEEAHDDIDKLTSQVKYLEEVTAANKELRAKLHQWVEHDKKWVAAEKHWKEVEAKLRQEKSNLFATVKNLNEKLKAYEQGSSQVEEPAAQEKAPDSPCYRPDSPCYNSAPTQSVVQQTAVQPPAENSERARDFIKLNECLAGGFVVALENMLNDLVRMGLGENVAVKFLMDGFPQFKEAVVLLQKEHEAASEETIKIISSYVSRNVTQFSAEDNSPYGGAKSVYEVITYAFRNLAAAYVKTSAALKQVGGDSSPEYERRLSEQQKLFKKTVEEQKKQFFTEILALNFVVKGLGGKEELNEAVSSHIEKLESAIASAEEGNPEVFADLHHIVTFLRVVQEKYTFTGD